MDKIRKVFASFEFQVLIFIVGCIAFGWPLVSIADVEGTPYLFLYLFGLWFLLILILGGIGWAGFSEPPQQNDSTGDDAE